MVCRDPTLTIETNWGNNLKELFLHYLYVQSEYRKHVFKGIQSSVCHMLKKVTTLENKTDRETDGQTRSDTYMSGCDTKLLSALKDFFSNQHRIMNSDEDMVRENVLWRNTHH